MIEKKAKFTNNLQDNCNKAKQSNKNVVLACLQMPMDKDHFDTPLNGRGPINWNFSERQEGSSQKSLRGVVSMFLFLGGGGGGDKKITKKIICGNPIL